MSLCKLLYFIYPDGGGGGRREEGSVCVSETFQFEACQEQQPKDCTDLVLSIFFAAATMVAITS